MTYRTRNGKYNAYKTYQDGYTFDSQAEARRYQELRLLEHAGEIDGLKVHPGFELQEKYTYRPPGSDTEERVRAIRYEADFLYRDMDTGQVVVEDVKGARTHVWRLKWKLARYLYPQYVWRVVEA